ncbi:hypothetical protein JXA88_01325 [Candidatus Fermentibacteria bacterium]|nr:hypothetical protein [Candidatus Fermentibacteria bacterium]
MQKITAQLDIFDTPTQIDTSTPTDSPGAPQSAAVEILDPPETGRDEDIPHTYCLAPSAGIQECRDCWERHPELWARYVTRANCVKHNR